MSNKQILMNHLDAYAQLLIKQIKQFGYCGEFISDETASAINETRLLCQTRGIFFLIDYAAIKQDSQYIKLAEQLADYIQNTYYDTTQQIWTQYPKSVVNQNTAKDKMLYEYAFVITAYAKLYGVIQNPELLEYINQVSNIVFSEYYNHIAKFAYLYNSESGINQNALMHLFESFIEVTNNIDDPSYVNDLQVFGSHLLEQIYDNEMNLIREYSKKKLYEPGHSFEWASLIYEAVSKGVFNTTFEHSKLALNAEKFGVYQNLALSEYNPLATSDNQQIRIWPSLERLRYYAMTGQPIAEIQDKLTQVFFSAQNLPYEYVNANLEPQQQRVKATTGYHIINCYKYIL